MSDLNFSSMRVAFQGEPGAFSEALSIQLLPLTLSCCLILPSAVISALACVAETESATAKGSFVLPEGQTPETALFKVPDLLKQNSLVCSALAIPGARKSIHPIDSTAIRP